MLALRNIREKEADIVYIDPPYQEGQYTRVLAQLAAMPYITENTLILVECAQGETLSEAESIGFTIVREKDYKTNRHLFLRKAAT